MPAFTSSTFNRYAGKWLIAIGVFELALGAVFGVLRRRRCRSSPLGSS